MAIDWNSLITSMLSAVILFLVSAIYQKMKAHWKRQERQGLLVSIKVDSMIYALGKLPNSLGDQFLHSYQLRFSELATENKFVDEQ